MCQVTGGGAESACKILSPAPVQAWRMAGRGGAEASNETYRPIRGFLKWQNDQSEVVCRRDRWVLALGVN